MSFNTYWRPRVVTPPGDLDRPLAGKIAHFLGWEAGTEPQRIGPQGDMLIAWLQGYIAAEVSGELREQAVQLRDALRRGDVELWVGP